MGLVLGLAVQISAWLMLTHVQSRFLLPCLLTVAPLVGLGAGFVRTPRGTGAGLGVLVCLVQAGGAWAIFAGERGGRPNALLVAGPGVLMGEPYSPELGGVSAVAYVNHELPAGARVLLVGGATPLYFKKDVVYATTWDRPAVMEVEDSGRAVGFVLIDETELGRLRGSGILDPGLTPEFVEGLKDRLGFVRAWGGVSLWEVEGEGGVDGLGVRATGSGNWGTDRRDACPTGRSEGGRLEEG